MKNKNKKKEEIKEYEKLTKIVKEAFRSAQEFAKNDAQRPSSINFKSC